jgi:hypothetical protein
MKTSTVYLKNIVAILALTLIFISCKKPAGEGGKVNIKGTLWAEDWNGSFTVKNGEYAAYDEDVILFMVTM